MALYSLLISVGVLVLPAVLLFLLLPRFIYFIGSLLGWRLASIGRERRDLVLQKVVKELKDFEDERTKLDAEDHEWEKIDESRNGGEKSMNAHRTNHDWEGIIGFLHPFCNAGGGGERVLWAAVRATQKRWPNAICAVYTGDHEVSKDELLERVFQRFNIRLHPPTVVLVYLSTRHYVLASTWPHFTLLGQSIGSVILAYDAFTMLVPDIFIDTMGYAFAIALCKWLFPKVPTAAYVHYPTISTDMLGSLDEKVDSGKGLHVGAGKGWRGHAKRQYWHLFAKLYGWAGGSIDVVMTNSSWTQGHIKELWGPSRARQKHAYAAEVLYPPCPVEDLEQSIEVTEDTERQRRPCLLYIAQFRPEKNHQLVLEAFARFFQQHRTADGESAETPRLILMGSVRNDADETHIYSLRILARELHISDWVTFILNASWSTMMFHLRTASVGVNAMWNEHFGIGVVEYQAAGLISVVNDSGGPKMDIVVDNGNGPTGYHASTAEEYAAAFSKALALDPEEAFAMRLRARQRAKTFNENAFQTRWVEQVEKLMKLMRV